MPTARNGYFKENIRPTGDGGAGLVSKMGAYEDSRRKLREERNREYNQFLAKVGVCATIIGHMEDCMFLLHCQYTLHKH